MEDPRAFGIALANNMISQIAAQHTTAKQTTHLLATEVAWRANEMLAQGIAREDVSAWVQAVQLAFSERLKETVTSLEGTFPEAGARAATNPDAA